MAIKFNKENKEVKAHTSKPGKLCSWTLAIQIILSVALGILGLSPVLGGAAGFILGAFLVILAILMTAVTAGLTWINEGVRNFFGKGFDLSKKIMEGSGQIVPTLKPYIVAISLPIFFVSTIGFIYNLIYYKKHDKANKGRFITSCVFLGLAIINLVICLAIFLTCVVSK